MSTRKMENFSLKDNEKTEKQKPSMSIEEWLNDHSQDLGPWQRISEVRSVGI